MNDTSDKLRDKLLAANKRIDELEAGLHRIANFSDCQHAWATDRSAQNSYDLGILDGHNCAGRMARETLTAAPAPQNNLEETA